MEDLIETLENLDYADFNRDNVMRIIKLYAKVRGE